jgi:hypothetical protein
MRDVPGTPFRYQTASIPNVSWAFFNWNMAIDPYAVLDFLNALEFLLIEKSE